jgi:hypothetical protein
MTDGAAESAARFDRMDALDRIRIARLRKGLGRLRVVDWFAILLLIIVDWFALFVIVH